MSKRTATHSFRGFDDEIEVFRAGEHTDAAGNTRIWSEADLDEIVANHSDADAAPIVVGHPKTNDPAFGWTASLRRDGERLLARFKDVATEFAAAVEAGHFRKRSVRVNKGPNGWRLVHVGFLGAAAPAVPGLAALSYSEPEGECHDFEADWYTPNILARMMRRMREFLVEQFGVESADRVMPDYEIDSLAQHANDAQRQETVPAPTAAFAAAAPAVGVTQPCATTASPMRVDSNEASSPHSSDHSNGGIADMPTQEDIERARKEARDEAAAEFAEREKTLSEQLAAERATRLQAEFNAAVTAAIDRGVAPAVIEGMAEFMASLAAQDDAPEFEFSAGGQPQKTRPLDFARALLDRIPATVALGEHSDAGDTVDHNDAEALAKAAMEYVATEAAAGRTVSISQAVTRITKGGK